MKLPSAAEVINPTEPVETAKRLMDYKNGTETYGDWIIRSLLFLLTRYIKEHKNESL